MLTDLTHDRAQHILTRAQQQPLLIVGDVILDSTVYGNVTRISAEAPVPVVDCQRTTYAPGGAANVACGIVALGGRCDLLSLGGDSAELRRVTDLLPHRVHPHFVGLRRLPHKQRLVANGQQIARLDHPPDCPATPENEADLWHHIRTNWPENTRILLSDYNLGTVTPGLFEQLKQHGYPLLLDPHPLSPLVPAGATLLKPNRAELYRLAEMRPHHREVLPPIQDDDLLAAVQRVEQRFQPEELLVTLGAQGILVKTRDTPVRFVAALGSQPPLDVCGAGDTVFATYALARAGEATPLEAAQLAVVAARIVIDKPGTAWCHLHELLERL